MRTPWYACLGLLCLIACGDDDDAADEPDPSPAKQDANTPPPTPSEPSCAELALRYDGSACHLGGCTTTVPCECEEQSVDLAECSLVLGCLTGIDCALACTYVEAVSICMARPSCASDADCGAFYCVGEERGAGQCQRGEPGDACRDATDCSSGHCEQVSERDSSCRGTLAQGEPCSADVECASGICYQDFSGSRPVGSCSSGAEGSPCNSDDECIDSHCAYATTSSVCTQGAFGDRCDADEDCETGSCAYGGRLIATCVNGELDQPCDTDDDCLSAHCGSSVETLESRCSEAESDAGVELDAGAL